MPKVTFEREQIVVEAPRGATLLDVCEKTGIDVFRGMWTDLHCKRVKGWCNRCKVWVKPETPSSVNPPTAAERMPLRLNGRVSGTMRLACQVQVLGDLTVHTRAGGPEVKSNARWEPTTEPSRWKERWEKRHETKGQPEEEDSADAEA
jgi:ferredoxin